MYFYILYKYDDVQTFSRLENPGFAVDEITLVMAVFAGYSENLPTDIGKLFDKYVTLRIVKNMQKTVISNEAHLSRPRNKMKKYELAMMEISVVLWPIWNFLFFLSCVLFLFVLGVTFSEAS